MTFTEAALAVLEREGRSMQVKEIAEKALAWNLLSHVGKTPVQTMSTQISAAVAKGPSKSPFVRVKPGVFALAKWDGRTPGPSKQAQAPKEQPQPGKQQPAKQPPPAKQPSPARQPPPAKQPSPARQPQVAKQEQPAKQPQVSVAPEADGNGEPSGRKRRRRRRKKRGGEESSAVAPAPASQPAGLSEERPAAPATKPAPQAASRPAPLPAAQVKPRENGADEQDLADRIEAFLRGQSRPASVEAIAERLGFRGRSGRLLVEATLVSDRLEQEQRGERPRFTQHRGGFSLAEREVSGEIIALEQQIAESVARLRRLAEQKLVRRMRSLDLKSLAKLVALYLKRFGFGEAEPVERGGEDELHLSVQDRRRGGRFRTAIIVRRDGGRPLTADAVTELRGSLHHYLSTRGMIITSGGISDEARTEAEVQNLAPIALVDGDALARELIRFGVGIRERSVRLPVFDDALLAELGG